MKKINIIIALMATIIFSNCKPKVQSGPYQVKDYSAEVKYLSKDESGTITVESGGIGKNENEAIAEAQKRAFNILLFKGLPGTELNVPLIDNEYEATSKHRDYFQNFFEHNYYSTFMMESSVVSSSKIKGGGAMALIDLKINYNSLRKDLEQNNIIRKFGF